MRLLTNVNLLITAIFLSYVLVGGFNQKRPFKVELYQAQVEAIKFPISNVKLTSLDENLTVQNIRVNRGECQSIFPKSKGFPYALPENQSIEFSTIASLDEACKVSLIDVETNFGKWRLKF